MKRFTLVALVASATTSGAALAQMTPNDELTRMDATLTQALIDGDQATAMR